MINCADNTYYIYYTDASTGAIAIPKSSLIQSYDITLIGKARLEYGEVLNQNILNLIEHFASPSNGVSPDATQTYMNLLNNPVIGQLWYNSLDKSINVCQQIEPSIIWSRISDMSDVAGNAGILSDGEYIPLPISQSGYEFTQEECVWNVAPHYFNTTLEVMGVDIGDTDRQVRCRFMTPSGEVMGMVNYLILGIRNQPAPDQINIECPAPSPTPTPSVTATIGASPTPAATSTVTPTATPPATATKTPAVTPSVSSSAGAPVTPTPTQTPPVTNTITPTATPPATPAVTNTTTPTATPPATAAPTPSVTPSAAGNEISNLAFIGRTCSIPLEATDNSAQASYRLLPDYTIMAGTSYAAESVVGDWLTGPPGNASNYEVSFTITSQDSGTGLYTTSDAPDTWYTGGINIIMWADNPNVAGNPDLAPDPGSIYIDLTIREIANPSNSATFNGMMRVAVGL